jgi:hypothetical protein
MELLGLLTFVGQLSLAALAFMLALYIAFGRKP